MRLRLITVAAGALLAAFVITLTLLVPSYLLAVAIKDDVLVGKGIVEQSISSNENSDLKAELAKAAEEIRALSANPAYKQVSWMIRAVLDAKIPGVSLARLDYTVLADSGRQLALSGTASDRQTLLSFKAALVKTRIFSSVELPVSDFVDERDINFTMTLNSSF